MQNSYDNDVFTVEVHSDKDLENDHFRSDRSVVYKESGGGCETFESIELEINGETGRSQNEMYCGATGTFKRILEEPYGCKANASAR